jgi:hypothetical protein
MSGLAYIQNTLQSWDKVRHADYKIKNFIFVCPKQQYKEWKNFNIKVWQSDTHAFGIASSQKQVRVTRVYNIMDQATLYMANTKQREDLKNICEAQCESIREHDKALMRECYSDFVKYLMTVSP